MGARLCSLQIQSVIGVTGSVGEHLDNHKLGAEADADAGLA